MAEAQAQIEGSRRDAAERLALEMQNTRRAEQALLQAKNTQELKDATHRKTIDSLSDRLRTLAVNQRLRDPHAAQAPGCGAGHSSPAGDAATAPGGRAADPAQACGILSAELAEVLQRLTREADDINLAYASCRADAYTVRADR